MQKMFLMLALLVVSAFAVPRAANAQVDCRVQYANPACVKHNQAPGGVVPYSDLRCFNIHQVRDGGIVTLNIYDANGVLINADDAQHSQVKKAVDQFCIGRHWMTKGYIFEWCTDLAGRVWTYEGIQKYYAQGWAPTIELVPSPNNRPHRPSDLPQGRPRIS